MQRLVLQCQEFVSALLDEHDAFNLTLSPDRRGGDNEFCVSIAPTFGAWFALGQDPSQNTLIFLAGISRHISETPRGTSQNPVEKPNQLPLETLESGGSVWRGHAKGFSRGRHHRADLGPNTKGLVPNRDVRL